MIKELDEALVIGCEQNNGLEQIFMFDKHFTVDKLATTCIALYFMYNLLNYFHACMHVCVCMHCLIAELLECKNRIDVAIYTRNFLRMSVVKGVFATNAKTYAESLSTCMNWYHI